MSINFLLFISGWIEFFDPEFNKLYSIEIMAKLTEELREKD
jgi:hypothetical protein